MGRGRNGTDGAVYRILIVDDHPVMRLGLRNLIAQEPDLSVCGDATDARTALQAVEETEPHLAVIDLSLRDTSGIELIKQLSAKRPLLKILVVSMHDESLFAERALRAGALGYINKEEAADKVIDGIRQVLDGKVYLSRRMTEQMLRLMTKKDQQLELPAVATLSDRELEVFEQIGKGRSTRDIAEHLNLSMKTIDTYRENIKRKLALDTNIELIRRAVQWVLQER